MAKTVSFQHNKMILKFWKSILWAGFIAFLLVIPGNRLPKARFLAIQNLDKLIHFFLFLLLELFILTEGQLQIVYSFKKIMKLTVIATVYAVFTELLQLLLPISRTGSWWDFFADTLGLISGLMIITLYYGIKVRAYSRKQ
jgi:VanZ family protein